MYVIARPAREPEGLGIVPWLIPIIAAVAGAFGTAGAARLFSGPSSTSQKAVEEQIKLQHELEIKRMLEQERIQREQGEQLKDYVPLALGALVLVAVLS